MQNHYLVFGASGYIGGYLVPFLSERGVRVRAASRNRAVLAAREWNNVELVEADALRPESLAAALADIDVAFYLVHSMASGKHFGALDIQAAENFARAAALAGVKRIVYLGGLVPQDGDLGEHISSRRDTGTVLRDGATPVTEIRSGIIIGPGSAAFEVMRDLALNLPLMVTPRWVRATSPPIALSNILEYLWVIARTPEAVGEIYEAGGPEEVDYTVMMRSLARLAGKSPPLILPVPVLTPTLSSYWLALVTAVPAPIAAALITGLRHSFKANDASLRAIAPQRLLSVDEAISAALEQEKAHKTLARWSDGNFALRGFRHEHSFYSKQAGGSAVAQTSPHELWQLITQIGGRNRYFYMNWLWLIREIMDWLIAGPGLSRGRRDPTDLRIGDRIDYWTVLALQKERSLTLHFGLRAPGSGALEFRLEPVNEIQTRLHITAYWHPRGVWGLLYWYAMLPAHLFLFKGWTKRLARLAERKITYAR
jgi:uncharacterized protein YbjT (DUF2867 family)